MLGSARVEAKVKYRSRAARVTAGEASGVGPSTSGNEDPAAPDVYSLGVPYQDAPLIPSDDALGIPVSAIPGDTSPCNTCHLGILLGNLIT